MGRGAEGGTLCGRGEDVRQLRPGGWGGRVARNEDDMEMIRCVGREGTAAWRAAALKLRLRQDRVRTTIPQLQYWQFLYV